MNYCSTDHFYEQQGMLINWFRNELNVSIGDLIRYSDLTVKDIEDLEEGCSSDTNYIYNKCIVALIRYSYSNGHSFTDLLGKLADTRKVFKK